MSHQLLSGAGDTYDRCGTSSPQGTGQGSAPLRAMGRGAHVSLHTGPSPQALGRSSCGARRSRIRAVSCSHSGSQTFGHEGHCFISPMEFGLDLLLENRPSCFYFPFLFNRDTRNRPSESLLTLK